MLDVGGWISDVGCWKLKPETWNQEPEILEFGISTGRNGLVNYELSKKKEPKLPFSFIKYRKY